LEISGTVQFHPLQSRTLKAECFPSGERRNRTHQTGLQGKRKNHSLGVTPGGNDHREALIATIQELKAAGPNPNPPGPGREPIEKKLSLRAGDFRHAHPARPVHELRFHPGPTPSAFVHNIPGKGALCARLEKS